MKRVILAILCLLFITGAFAQTSEHSRLGIISPNEDINYRLFPTQNIWTFLKLDTRNGIVHIVQCSTEDNAMEYPLNDTPLALGAEAVPDRFYLYPSGNIYNFILIDQIDGRVWQVQWHQDRASRLVIPIKLAADC